MESNETYVTDVCLFRFSSPVAVYNKGHTYSPVKGMNIKW